MEGRFVSPGTASGMDTYTVVVASVVCEAKNVDLQISELSALSGDIGSGPGTPFPEPEVMLDVPDLWSFVDAGPERTAPVSGDASNPPVSVSLVVSRSGPPKLGFVDKLKLPDVPSDFDQWPGEPSPEPTDVLVR